MSSKQSQKGSRFEYLVRDKLSKKTGTSWERVPASGAGTLKGDLYCPTNHYYYCFECKSYKDGVIQENLLSAKSNNLYAWWEQTTAQAEAMNRKPALVFKKDRGKHLILVEEYHEEINSICLEAFGVVGFIYLFDEWLDIKDREELILV